MLPTQQRLQMPAVSLYQLPPGRMLRRQISQRLGVAQRGKPVAPTPVIRNGTGVPEKPIVLLHIAAVPQKSGQQLRVSAVPRHPVGPSQHRPAHKHILNAEVGIAGRRSLAGAASFETVRSIQKQPAILRVPGHIRQPRRADHPRQGRAARLRQIRRRIPRNRPQ